MIVIGATGLFRSVISYGIVLLTTNGVFAAPPAATLLPNTTKSYVSFPKFKQASENFDKTQVGQLMAAPAMQPFMEDAKKQIRERMMADGVKLGITLEDLDTDWPGEVCYARVQPDGSKSHGLVAIVDVTDRKDKVDQLLAKVTKAQLDNGSKQSAVTIAGVSATRFDLKQKPGQLKADVAIYGISDDVLVASDSLETAEYVFGAIAQPASDSLSQMEAFKAVMARAEKGRQAKGFDLQWFAEPFGYAEVMRAEQPRNRRGKDMLELLRNQGFDSVQGIGGQVTFLHDDIEVVHSTFIYAPKDAAAESGDRFRLGARILSFPNDANHQIPDFVPEQVATYLDLRWDIQRAFQYVESIVNEYADDDDWYREMLISLKEDINSPRVDIENDIVKNLGNQVYMMVDNELPAHEFSEQRLLGFQIVNVAPVEAAINKIFKNDPTAEKHEYQDQVIWEIHEEEEEEVPTLMIVAPGYDNLVYGALAQDSEPEPGTAVAVVDNFLFFANNKEIVKKAIDAKLKGATLAKNADYQRVQVVLKTLGSGSDSVQYFAESEAALRANYELMQQGKMPESNSVVGKAINYMLSDGDDPAGDRTQNVDASKLPPFDEVKQYLGPSGAYSQSEDNGWYATGAMLKK